MILASGFQYSVSGEFRPITCSISFNARGQTRLRIPQLSLNVDGQLAATFLYLQPNR